MQFRRFLGFAQSAIRSRSNQLPNRRVTAGIDRVRKACIEALEDRKLFTAAYALIGEAGTTLIRFDTTNPSVIQDAVTVSGLQPGETLQGIDFRPVTGVLYGLGVVNPDAGSDTARLYTINTATGAATQLGTPIGGLADGSRLGFDFNPAADRIRVVNAADQSFRLNPNDGTLAGTDTSLDNASDSEAVVAVAYDRNDKDPSTPTTLFGIDFGLDDLVRIGGVNGTPSPNGGVVTKIGDTGVTASDSNIQFDIGTDGAALAIIPVGGLSGLYSIDLTTGAATLIGPVGTGADTTRGFAINVDAVANAPDVVNDGYSTPINTPLTVSAPGVLMNDTDPNGDSITVANFTQPGNGTVAMNADGSFSYTPNLFFAGTDTFTYKATDGTNTSFSATVTITVTPSNLTAYAVVGASTLIKFVTNAPGTIVDTVPVQGLQVGERLLGIDFRPADRALYGLGSSGRIYKIDTNTGATTGVVLTADPIDATNPFAALSGTSFGVDFNPVPDRMRVTSNSNQNLRINVDTGAVITDDNLNPGIPDVVGAGYSNPDNNPATGTTLYTIDRAANTLNIQNPPNNGTQVLVGTGLGVDVTGDLGFDVARDGRGFLAATDAGTGLTRFYSVNLIGGGATLIGNLGNGAQSIDGLAVTIEGTVPVASNDSYSTEQDVPLNVPAPGVLGNDSGAVSASIIANATSGMVVLNPDGSFTYTPNAGYTGPDSFTYQASNGLGEVSNVATVDLTVTPPPPPPTPTVSIIDADKTVVEGNSGTKTLTFTVKLSTPATAPVSVKFATANGSATQPSDYVQKSGTLNFSIGQQTKTFTLLVNGDTTVEPNEQFKVNLFNATGATIGDDLCRINITNDDGAAVKPKLSVGGVSLTEGNSGTKAFQFKVTLDKAATGTVTVKFVTSNGTATAGSDYTSATGTLTFAAGETFKMVTVLVKGDTAKEADETFFLNLNTPTNATIAVGKGTGTIRNDD